MSVSRILTMRKRVQPEPGINWSPRRLIEFLLDVPVDVILFGKPDDVSPPCTIHGRGITIGKRSKLLAQKSESDARRNLYLFLPADLGRCAFPADFPRLGCMTGFDGACVFWWIGSCACTWRIERSRVAHTSPTRSINPSPCAPAPSSAAPSAPPTWAAGPSASGGLGGARDGHHAPDAAAACAASPNWDATDDVSAIRGFRAARGSPSRRIRLGWDE
ncbi:hypothetical protein BDK51DRAFT_52511 [Blyttiomyces helicus]|uniref:Uncharacterized protein n=1 Tax=Blyttiomyces helicus TaxID=388810 RepID=A0A4V1IQV6_9FUNG|nr:hypothetical protein BDK51DRAFT_52511 [Blyttiomyces helicus]|eukprot:RKO87887.1 hypothetical protein BDK51DRAFT_52511 [Blyttiomyces helicus]